MVGDRGWVNGCSMPYLRQDRLEQHLDRWMIEPAGEHFAVIGQKSARAPRAGYRWAQPRYRRRGCVTSHQLGTDTHLEVIVDAGQRLGAAAVSQSWAHLDRAGWIDNPHDPVLSAEAIAAAQ